MSDPVAGQGQGAGLPPMGRFEGAAHILPIRVYYEDTDAGGIVYHANYLRFCERARNEFMRLLGYSHSLMIADTGVAFAVRHCEIDFRQPARLDDALEVVTRISDIGGATLDAVQTVRRIGPLPDSAVLAAGGNGMAGEGAGPADLVRMTIRLACINQMGRPVRLPKALRTALDIFLSGQRQD